MGTNTPEYRAMIQSTSDLTNAVKVDIGPLSEELLGEGLIAADNWSAANNPMIDVGQRASQLVSLVRTRIQLNPSNFHKFIRILLKRASFHRDILEILDNRYRALGGVKETGISATLASLAEQDLAAAQQVTPTVTQLVSAVPSSQHTHPQATSSSSSTSQQTPVVSISSNKSHVSLDDSMSDEQFVEWLKARGMTQSGDRDKIIGEGINAQSFPYLEDVDVREVIGKLSLGGRGIFRKLWREYRMTSENEDTLSSHLDTELDFRKVHFKVSQFLRDIPPIDLRSLGGALGISHSKLIHISDSELAEGVVAAWLRREDNVLMVGKPTLRILATHLKAIGQSGLAHDIISTSGSCVLAS